MRQLSRRAAIPFSAARRQRSARASSRERYLVFDCGPLGDGGHGHYDALSIEVACGGAAGRRSGPLHLLRRSAEWRRWFKSTAAHNTVYRRWPRPDGLPPGKPKQRLQVRLLNRASTPLVDIVGGEVKSPAVQRHPPAPCAVRRQRILARHRRARGPDPHDYDLRYHLAADALGAISVSAEAVAAPGVRLLLDGPGAIVIEPGWIAADYGVKDAAPIVSKRAAGCQRAAFVTAIVPVASSNVAAAQHLAVRWVEGGGAATVDGAGVRGECVDRIEWWIGSDGCCWAAVERGNW